MTELEFPVLKESIKFCEEYEKYYHDKAKQFRKSLRQLEAKYKK